MSSWDEPRVRELHEALVALYEPVERTRERGADAGAGFRPAEGVTSAGFPYTTTTASVCQQFRNGPVVAGDSRNS